VCKILIKNSQPFGKKISENRRGDFFLTHTVGGKCWHDIAWILADIRPQDIAVVQFASQ